MSLKLLTRKDMEQIDWGNIGFGYMKTDYNVRCLFSNGAWGELEVHDSEMVGLSIIDLLFNTGNESLLILSK
jgi:branched-chain amino acid aminotransferase